MAELTNEQILAELRKVQQELQAFKNEYSIHQHNDVDGTNHLRKNIVLDQDQSVVVGCLQAITASGFNPTDGVNYFAALVDGEDMRNAYVAESPNMQLLLTHVPNSSSKFSFVTASRSPLVASYANTSITVTAGGNTVTIAGYDFTTNELAGAYINIYDSSGTLIETQTVLSNTSTVVTIVGTWLNSTSGGVFDIYVPVFIGRTQSIWRRLYVEEGSATGGVRIGPGPTANGQNGLLYMDAAGDLYWRDKAGTSVKVNGGLAGTKTYYVANSSGGAVTRKLTFTNGILTSET